MQLMQFICLMFMQAGDPPSKPDPAMKVVIDQSDMYTHVFSVFEDNKVCLSDYGNSLFWFRLSNKE